MIFDIVEYTEDELKAMTSVQMTLLRTAQKKKNDLAHLMEQQLSSFRKKVYTNGMQGSTLYEQKKAELQAEFEYEVEVIREQLLYSMANHELYPDVPVEPEETHYVVDYSLPYSDRYAIVRQYYLSINDPQLRMTTYAHDEVAKKYLGSFYTTLYDVLYSMSFG